MLAVGSYRSLDETRTAYYERYRFADVFAVVTRAPKSVAEQVAQIPGSRALRRESPSSLCWTFRTIPSPRPEMSFRCLISENLSSINSTCGPAAPQNLGRADEVVVNDTFAKAHGFGIGSRFSALLNGRKRDLVIVETALSPEFIYTVGPGDLMPDDRRFAIIWMSEKALAGAYNLEGAFSSISVKLLRDATERDVITQLDALLDRYGGRAAYGRKDQTSHAWIDHELDMLSNMSRTLTPIFLLVSAFLVNLTLTS